MAQISLYIDDAMLNMLHTAAQSKNCSLSKYVASIISERLLDDNEDEMRKKELLRRLHGAANDHTLAEPLDIPWEMEINRRFDLI
jgi:hypothetical protein